MNFVSFCYVSINSTLSTLSSDRLIDLYTSKQVRLEGEVAVQQPSSLSAHANEFSIQVFVFQRSWALLLKVLFHNSTFGFRWERRSFCADSGYLAPDLLSRWKPANWKLVNSRTVFKFESDLRLICPCALSVILKRNSSRMLKINHSTCFASFAPQSTSDTFVEPLFNCVVSGLLEQNIQAYYY